MRVIICNILFLLAVFCPFSPVQAKEYLAPDQVLWLSDDPPTEEYDSKLGSSHAGPVEYGRGGVTFKRLWLRSGHVPQKADYVAQLPEYVSDFRLIDPGKEIKELEPFESGAGTGLYFAVPDEGYYNAYVMKRRVTGSTLRVQSAKAEVLRHLCSEGHDYSLDLVAAKNLEQAPLEIVRLREPGEDFHFRLKSGDRVRFQVLAYGKPASEARLTLISSRGWSRTRSTDKQGKAEFELIRDYYSRWQDFDRDRRDNFLAVAELKQEKSGSYRGDEYSLVHYQASLAGRYSIPSGEYQSYAHGLWAGIFFFAAGLVLVIFYRRRRRRSWEEMLDGRS